MTAAHDPLTDTEDVGTAFDDLPTDEATPALAGQLVEVLVEGEPLYAVRIVNRDRLLYEKTALKHREWPPPSATSHTMTFLTWAAARREGRTDVTFERWQTILEDFDVVADVPADPTR